MFLKSIFLIVSAIFFFCSIINFFVCLSLYYYAAAVWCLFSGVTSGLTAHLSLLKRRDRLSHWYGLEELDYLKRLAFGLIAITISGFVYHFVYGSLSYHYNHTYDLYVALAITQSFIAGFWSLVLKLLIDKMYEQLISLN